MRLLYFDEDLHIPRNLLLPEIGLIDYRTPICRSWGKVLEELGGAALKKYDALIHVIGSDQVRALERVDALSQLRVESNYSVRPQHVIVSIPEVEPTIRRQFMDAGAHFIFLDGMDGFSNRLRRELDLIQFKIAEVTCNIPRYFSIHEGNSNGKGCVPGEVPYLLFRFGKEQAEVEGPSTIVTLMTVMLMENGIFRGRRELRERLTKSVFYETRGGLVPIPSPTTLKTYLDQDIPEILQKVFIKLHSGFAADNVLLHKQLSGKAIGYKLLGEIVSTTHRH